MRDAHKELVIKTAIMAYEKSVMFGFSSSTPKAIKGMEDAWYMCAPYNIEGTSELLGVINLAKERFKVELQRLDKNAMAVINYDENGEVVLSADEENALSNWFATAENSSPVVTEKLYKLGKLDRLKGMTAAYYKEKGVKTVTMYRLESNTRENRVLEAWTPLKSVAESYRELRDGELLSKEIDVDTVILDTRIAEMYELYFDDCLGMIPGVEAIVAVK